MTDTKFTPEELFEMFDGGIPGDVYSLIFGPGHESIAIGDLRVKVKQMAGEYKLRRLDKYRVVRSKYPVDGEYDYSVIKKGDTSPTLEVFGRVAEGEAGKRDAAYIASVVCKFLNEGKVPEYDPTV